MDQVVERVETLRRIGHPVDKLEVLVLGGTWESYPEEYREGFIRDLFYAANTFFDDLPKREKYSLPKEQLINESTKVKIIGLTLETRPDTIFAAFASVFVRREVRVNLNRCDHFAPVEWNRHTSRGSLFRPPTERSSGGVTVFFVPGCKGVQLCMLHSLCPPPRFFALASLWCAART